MVHELEDLVCADARRQLGPVEDEGDPKGGGRDAADLERRTALHYIDAADGLGVRFGGDDIEVRKSLRHDGTFGQSGCRRLDMAVVG